jgi:endonuclease YncB( thermonuclease family)
MRALVVTLLFLPILPATAGWLTYEDCTHDSDRYYDGDSFHVEAPTGHTYIFRLYGVDCPETDTRYQDRIKEQAEEFGLDERALLKWGEQARDFTKKFLRKPFTVHTQKEKARGSSKKVRYFAIIINADGKRLDEALLEAGLARAHGMPAAWPKGTEPERFLRKLGYIENKAKREEEGLWEDTD